jgi:hypothetical protein
MQEKYSERRYIDTYAIKKIRMEESYPPRIEDLQAAFLVLHPDYRFSSVGFGHDQRGWDPCPIEIAGKNVWGCMSAGGACDQNGVRHNEWCKYIGDRGRELAQEAGVSLPAWGQMSIDPFRHLWLTIQWYRDICRNPALTPEARLSRERSRASAIRIEKERQERAEQQRLAAVAWAAKEEETRKEKARLFQLELAAAKAATATIAAIPAAPATGLLRLPKGLFPVDDAALVMRHQHHLAACRTRDALCARHGLSPADAEAVLARKDGSFPKDTLAALRAINEFARANGIRFEDAEQVLQEVIGH